MNETIHRNRWLIAVCYAAIYIVWGSTYFAIKVAVSTMPAVVVVGARWLVGGALFLLYAWATGREREIPIAKEVWSSVVLGIVLVAIPNLLVTTAEKTVDSYLAAICASSIPMCVALFDRFIIGKKAGWPAIIGIILGMIGVSAVVYNGHSMFASINSGVVLLAAAMVPWAWGTSISHRMALPKDNVINTGLQMAVGGVVCSLPTVLSFGSAGASVGFSSASLVALGYLGVIGSLAFGAYTYLLKHEPAVRIASYAFVNPLIAVGIGIGIGKEGATPYLGFGLGLVLSGLFLMFYGELILKTAQKRFSSVPEAIN